MADQELIIQREGSSVEEREEEEEEQEPAVVEGDSSVQLERELSAFRQQWRKELQVGGKGHQVAEEGGRKGSPSPVAVPGKRCVSAGGDTPPSGINSNVRGVISNAVPAAVDGNSNSGGQQQEAEIAAASQPAAAPRMKDQNANSPPDTEELIEIKAKELFIEGVKAERRGNFTEAICKYRHAIQLVPDVESKITDYSFKKDDETENDIQEGYEDEEIDVATVEDGVAQLESELRCLTTNDIRSHCEPEFPQSSTHISALPVELLLYIFRWVVSSDLDLRSLEVLSSVCRGFYVCARDPSLWHRACLSIFGPCCIQNKEYSTWRQVYLERPHPLFNGVYISRNTYFRKGEPNMDGIYRPWHMVEYYRYVRLFPDGTMLMYNGPEEPVQVVSKLRNQTTSLKNVMIGHYGFAGDKVTGVLRRENTKVYDNHLHRYIRYKRHAGVKLETEHTFYVELCIRSCGHHPNSKLEWLSYSCHSQHRRTGNTNVTEFEVDKKFKALIFSRVKSYTKTSDKPM